MKKIFICLSFMFLFTINGETNTALTNNDNFIAHAGGGIDNLKYTNSLESLLKSIKQGFKFIELDINISRDNKLVFLHDWKSFKKYIGFKNHDGTPLLYKDYLTSRFIINMKSLL